MAIKTEDRIEATEQLIKYASGQYDTGLVRSLSLAHLSLRTLGLSLQNCSTLTVLDISSNSLESLDGVEFVGGTLRRLDCSNNRLTTLRGVSTLVKLEVLNAAGNQVFDPNALYAELDQLPTLRSLHLQDYEGGGRQNPVCRVIPRYGETLMKRFAKLRCLDGHYFCHEDLNPQRIDAGDDDEFVLPVAQPWLNEGYFNTKGFDNGQRVGVAAEKQFRAALEECKRALDAAS